MCMHIYICVDICIFTYVHAAIPDMRVHAYTPPYSVNTYTRTCSRSTSFLSPNPFGGCGCVHMWNPQHTHSQLCTRSEVWDVSANQLAQMRTPTIHMYTGMYIPVWRSRVQRRACTSRILHMSHAPYTCTCMFIRLHTYTHYIHACTNAITIYLHTCIANQRPLTVRQMRHPFVRNLHSTARSYRCTYIHANICMYECTLDPGPARTDRMCDVDIIYAAM